jgi:hypothetical protein
VGFCQKVHIFLMQENLGTGQTLDFFGRTNMVPVPMGKNDELDFVWLDGSTLEPTFEFPQFVGVSAVDQGNRLALWLVLGIVWTLVGNSNAFRFSCNFITF